MKNENIKKIEMLKKQNGELWKAREEIAREYERTREAHNSEQYRKLSKKIQLNVVEMEVINNNITLDLYNIYVEEFKPLLAKYSNKAIGKKTREKINKELDEITAQHGYKMSIYIHTYNRDAFQYCDDIDFVHLNDEGFTSYLIKVPNFCEYYPNGWKGNFTGLAPHPGYGYIEDTRKEAKAIIKSKEESEKKIAKLQKQIEEIKKLHNDSARGALYDNMHI